MTAIPITGLYAGILGLMLLWLSIRIVASVRAKAEIGFGDGGDPQHTVVVRGQGNFVEYVPMAVILMAIDEMAGTSAPWIHGMGITLVIGRLLHPFGLTTNPGVNPLRFAGTMSTWVVIAIASVIAIAGYF